jgi:hypothetical protein
MKLSIPKKLALLVIAALAASSIGLRWNMEEYADDMAVQSAKLKWEHDDGAKAAEELKLKVRVCQKLLAERPAQSAAYTEALKRFEELRERSGHFSPEERNKPRVRMIPSVSDYEIDSYSARIFVPEQGKYALRIAVTPWIDSGVDQASPKSWSDAPIIRDSPFDLAEPITIHLTPGVHLYESVWDVNDGAKYTITLDDKQIAEIAYKNQLNSQQRHHNLGSYSRDGWLNPDQFSLLIRRVSPLESDDQAGPKYTLSCDLYRVDQ